MPKKSRRFVVLEDNIDHELAEDQLRQERGELPTDPAEIFGTKPGEVSRAVAEEEEEVIKRSLPLLDPDISDPEDLNLRWQITK